MPEGDADFPTRWRLIKTTFSKSAPLAETRVRLRPGKNERGVWQRRYWEHRIRNGEDFRRHLDYCYFNPMKHGHAANVRDWSHSTYQRDVRCGRFARDWVMPTEIKGSFGE